MLQSHLFSLQNIVDGQGLDLTLTGMAIVFAALMCISAFIYLLPKVLAWLEHIFPEADSVCTVEEDNAELEELAVAAACALHARVLAVSGAAAR